MTIQYIATPQNLPRPEAVQRGTKPGSGGDTYVGQVAEDYDKKRQGTSKWQIEQAIVEDYLGDVPEGSWVLDAPVGTGRFFDIYERRGFVVRCVDRSPEMLKKALDKLTQAQKNATIDGEAQWGVAVGDVRSLGVPDKSYDVVVCVRITRWLMGDYGPQGIRDWLAEAQRVARKRIIFTHRTEHKVPDLAVPEDLIGSCLEGWHVARVREGAEPSYKIVELRPIAEAHDGQKSP